MKLGEKIKLLRSEMDLTQPELARKAGIEQSYLSKVENEKGSPSFDVINRIAMSLETSGMEIINSLNQSYIEDKLSHIPEVAAEYAVIRKKRESSLKKRYIASAFIIVLGFGLLVLGGNNILYPEFSHNYISEGVVLEGEAIDQFSTSRISEIGETREEWKDRLKNNRDRNDRVYYSSYDTNVPSFIEKVAGGRRLYNYNGNTEIKRIQNDVVLIFGIMFIMSGFFAFFYNVRFKPY